MFINQHPAHESYKYIEIVLLEVYAMLVPPKGDQPACHRPESCTALHIYQKQYEDSTPLCMQMATHRIGSSGEEVVRNVQALVWESLADPHALSQHPASVGARFRLLLLGLKHARHLQVRSNPSHATDSVFKFHA